MLSRGRNDPQRDPDQGSYGIPDLTGMRVVEVIEPEHALYLKKVRQILSSTEDATKTALKANIDQFHEKLQERQRLRALEQKVEALDREIRRLKNSGNSVNEGDPATEWECAE